MTNVVATVVGASDIGAFDTSLDPKNTTGAGAIILMVDWGVVDADDLDNFGNHYDLVVENTTDLYNAIYICSAPIVGPGHYWKGPDQFSLTAIALMGSWELDTDATNGGVNHASTPSSVTSFQPGEVTPSVDGAFLCASTLILSGDFTGTVDIGTQLAQLGWIMGHHYGLISGYLEQDTAASVNPTFTLISNPSPMGPVIAAFRQTGGGGGGGGGTSKGGGRMPGILRQGTAGQIIVLGSFLDTDGVPATGLTIANTDIKITQPDGSHGNKHDSAAAMHAANGDYTTTVDATDTANAGNLNASASISGAGVVTDRYVVMPPKAYDALYAENADGPASPIQAGVEFDGTPISVSNTTVVLPGAWADDSLHDALILVYGSDQAYWQRRRVRGNVKDSPTSGQNTLTVDTFAVDGMLPSGTKRAILVGTIPQDDPLTQTVPGDYAAGTAGKAIGTGSSGSSGHSGGIST